MSDLATNIGEEWYTDKSIDGTTVKVGLYNDSTDGLSDTSNVSDITTEPTGSAYSRQNSSIATKQISGDFGFDNISKLEFDVSDSDQTVDHAFIIVNFQSSVEGQSSSNDNLVAIASLDQSRDLSGLSTLTISASDLQVVAN